MQTVLLFNLVRASWCIFWTKVTPNGQSLRGSS